MSQQLVQIESFSSNPSTLLSLFVLDGTAIGMSAPFFFLDGSTTSYQSVTFNSIQYIPFPIQASEFSLRGDGTIPRPKLTASNINGFVSNLLLQNANLIGATLIRRRVFARFLDAVNWPNGNPYGTPDPSASFQDEYWTVSRKVVENQQVVQWELSSAFELNGVKLPRRVILANTCVSKYRDPNTCGYTGVPLSDRNGKLFVGGAGTYGLTLNSRGVYSVSNTYNAGDWVTLASDSVNLAGVNNVFVCLTNGTTGAGTSPTLGLGSWVADQCPKNMAGCRIRFPGTQVLRIAAFPGASQAPFIVSR